MKLFEDLKWRGLIQELSSPKLEDKLNNEKLTFYLGTDPTADSLHVGHLAAFITAKRLKEAGHTCILLVGGATGRIGDPRPSAERQIIPEDVFEHNLNSLKKQVQIFGCDEVVDNYDWSKDINFIDFLRDFGKYFPVNYMISKDTVKRRLETGITYTEFSYMIMQSLDYLWLLENRDCTLQVAGSDQWGNITAGIDLIRRKTGKEVYGLCMPLILDENGNKIGKSEGNAVWIDKNKTSSYDIYQYFINTPDSMVIDYLKIFTFLSKEEIEELEKTLTEEAHLRLPAKRLAEEVVKFLHGEEDALKAKEAAEALFGTGANLDNMPTVELENRNISILDAIVLTGIAPSKGQARTLIAQGGISLNDEKVLDANYTLSEKDFKEGYAILKKGKKVYYKLV
ncbi:MAG: tyrosine--tRNA ligase [Oscillospiraceae bacterium]|nr:tyrosine--tRNA ligase [Oscillospiraceae bacterium]